METVKKYYRIDRREICFLHWIFEGYDGVATVTTLDPEKGFLRVAAAPGTEALVDRIVEGLKSGGILIERADFPFMADGASIARQKPESV